MAEYRPMAFALETERLHLRLRNASDAAWNLELLAESGNGVIPRTGEEERDRLALQEAAARDLGIGLLAIDLKGTSETVGYCGVIIGRCSLEEPEIVYELLRRFHGRGYATEAALAVRDAAVATGRKRLWSTVGAWNAPSLRVLAKIGFERHHVERSAGQADLVYLTYVA